MPPPPPRTADATSRTPCGGEGKGRGSAATEDLGSAGKEGDVTGRGATKPKKQDAELLEEEEEEEEVSYSEESDSGRRRRRRKKRRKKWTRKWMDKQRKLAANDSSGDEGGREVAWCSQGGGKES